MSRDALVIGINEYTDLDELEKPANDAEAIAQLLETKAGFRVKRLLNDAVGFDELEDAIVQLFNPETDQLPETALLFFAGHGLKEGFLAASNTNYEEKTNAISFKWLADLLQKSKIQKQIVVIDACFSGKFFDYVQATTTHDRCLITSARAHEEALDQGLLTQALLDCLDYTKQSKDTPWVTNDKLEQLLIDNNKTAEGWQRFQIRNTGQTIVLTNEAFENKIYSGICPYKGLHYFDNKSDDARYFKGRSKLTDELLEKIKQTNFLAIFGASGSGKSSIVRAGLLYQLPQTQRCKILPVITPTAKPMTALANIIKPAKQLGDFINEAKTERIVLVIDQFEEVFTLCQNNEEREQFFKILLEATEPKNNKFCLVVVMRADFFEKYLEHINLSKQTQDNSIYITPMTREELEETIVAPIKQVGLQIEPKLVSEMLVDVKGASGSLPLLQYTLTELYKKCATDRLFSFSAYEELGKIKGTLEKRADGIYKELSPTEQQVSKIIILELIQILEDKYTKRQVAIKQLENLEGFEPALVNQVVQKLVKANLVVTDKPKEEQVSVVNIAHEALIKHWKQLRGWLDENKESIKKQRSIEADAIKWKENNKYKDALLQGLNLDIAADYLKNHIKKVPLSSLALNFVQKSIKHRQKRRYSMIGMVTAVILVLAGFSYYSNEQRIVAEKQSKLAKQERDKTLRGQSLFLADLAHQETEKGNATNGILLALEALPKDMSNPKRSYVFEAEQSLYDAVSRLSEHAILTHKGGGKITQAIFSPDGQYVVTISGNEMGYNSDGGSPVVVASGDKNIRLWDVLTGKQVFVLRGHEAGINNVTFSPHGNYILTASNDKTARLWDAKTGKQILILQHKYNVTQVKFSPNGQHFITISKNNTSHSTAYLWDSNDIKQLLEIKSDDFLITSDGRYLFAHNYKNEVNYRLWNTNNGKPIKSWKKNVKLEYVKTIDSSVDGKYMILGGVWNDFDTDKTIISIILKVDTAEKILELSPQDGGRSGADWVNTVLFSPSNKYIFTSSWYGGTGQGLFFSRAYLWNTNTGQTITTLSEKRYEVNHVAFNPNDKQIITACNDGVARLWNIGTDESFDSPFLLSGHDSEINNIAFSPDGKFVLTVSEDKTAKLWKTNIVNQLLISKGYDVKENKKYQQLIKKASKVIEDEEFKKDYQYIFEEKPENSILGQPVYIVLSPNKSQAVIGMFKGNTYLWSIKDNKPIGILYGAGKDYDWSQGAAFNADGTRIAIYKGGETNGMIFRTFPNTQTLIDYAHEIVPRQLTPSQRKQFFLDN